jgi:hypothetical protein
MQNPHDISDAILARLSTFAVGLVKREEGKGSRVLGSGTLATIEGRRGILTCDGAFAIPGLLLRVG